MLKRFFMGMFLVIILGSVALAQVKPMLTTNGVLVTSDDASDMFALSYGNAAKVVFWVVTGTGKDIKAKGIDNDANQLWETNIATAANDQEKPYACVTTNNKVVVVWQDRRNAPQLDIYAKQINPSSGAQDWETRVTNKTSLEIEPQVCADDSGGIYIVWRNKTGQHLYLQHLDSSGNILIGGGAGGEKHLAAIDYRVNWKLIASGDGNAIVTYDKSSVRHILKADTNGNTLATFEAEVAFEPSDADIIKLEGSTGYIVSFIEKLPAEDPSTFRIRASKVDSDLNVVWEVLAAPAGGTGNFRTIRMAVDSSGNSYLFWNYQPVVVDAASKVEMDVWGQRLSSAGSLLWGVGGNAITTEEGIQGYWLGEDASRFPAAYYNGTVFIAWNDFRRDPSFNIDSTNYLTNEADIFIKGINTLNEDGLNNAVTVVSTRNAQILPEIAASYPFVFWYDGRDGSTQTIRCQRMEYIPVQISGITTVPAGTITINGEGFGSDPAAIENSNYTLGSDKNIVNLDGSSVEVTSWATGEITVVATYDLLALGSHTFEVTAYGDSGSYTFTISPPPPPVPTSSTITFASDRFGGAPYAAGGYVTANPTFEVTITSKDPGQDELAINTVTIEVNGTATDVTQDFSSDVLSISLTLPQGVNEVTYTVKVSAVDEINTGDSKSYTVKVAGEEEAAIIQYLIPSETVIDSQGVQAAAVGDITLAFNSSKAATINILIYTPAGRPIKLVREVNAGYNEIAMDRGLFTGSNGIYIISIYDKDNKLLGKTWITVRL